jgi:UDP-4-amino-4,6-dideoxy-N-acetyl-beta-L-altrosamine transaminase
MIPYGHQNINQDDIDAVEKILRSDFLTQGPAVPAFENVIEKYCDVKYGIAVNSATSALHIACLALGVGPGDYVWTTPITFVASANCALYCGATIDFVDIDPLTYNLSIERLSEKLSDAKKSGRLPKVVIPVHLSGQSCSMEGIFKLSQQYGFRVIEDASHAIGGRYQNQPIGNCRYSDITVFSFHPVKIITTGEGGMAVTNSPVFAKKMRLLRSHGITKDEGDMENVPDGPWYYEQIQLGFNYRMTDIQAALGVSQMARVDAYVAQRHKIAARYDRLLVGLPLQAPARDQDYSALHLYVIRLKLDLIGRTHHDVFVALREQGVGVNLHYIPIHTQPYYREMGFAPGDFPEAERYYCEAISLPIYPGLSDTDINKVVKALKTAISK